MAQQTFEMQARNLGSILSNLFYSGLVLCLTNKFSINIQPKEYVIKEETSVLHVFMLDSE